MTIGTRTNQARSSRNFRTCTLYGRYVATERPSRSVAKLEPSSVATSSSHILNSSQHFWVRHSHSKGQDEPRFQLHDHYLREATVPYASKDRRGSFKHFGIDLSKYSVNKEVYYLDIKYLMACHIMRDEETYSFFDKAGTQLFTKLHHPEITRFSVFDNIRFIPPPELLCTDPRAAAPDADMEDAYRRWMVDSQRKTNSLMRRILHLVTGVCIGWINQRQPPAEQTPRLHRPGKAPMGTGPSTEEVHRSRNRHSFDPAESGESD
uniref:Uncharacterized protein n=1 Tax=Brassica campestris TaxID=3711 RepID=M4FES7_BRACM